MHQTNGSRGEHGPSSRYGQQSRQFVEVNTALFVDFDNIFISLRDQDPALAEQFAINPDQWLKWLIRARFNVPQGARYRRNILVRRCYLNPRSFYEYRPYFIKGAFNVVDCPPLTSKGKTSADIHMVLDILDALNHPTHFDEFIIFSGDSDFTPVLIKLREHNRKTAILSVGPTSPAYKSASNWLIREDFFIEGALGFRADDYTPIQPQGGSGYGQDGYGQGGYGQGGYRQGGYGSTSSRQGGYTAQSAPAPQSAPVPPAQPVPPADPALAEQVAEFVKEEIIQADNPIHLPQLGELIRKEFSEDLPSEGWPGYLRLADYVAHLDLEPYELSTSAGVVYDPERHKLPETENVNRQFREDMPELYSFASRVHNATDVPLLMPDHYRAFFDELAEEVAKNGYQLTQTSRNVRDRCIALGLPVARSQANFILIGISRVGYAYKKDGSDNADDLAKAFARNVFDLCSAAQLDLSEDDVKRLFKWIMPRSVNGGF